MNFENANCLIINAHAYFEGGTNVEKMHMTGLILIDLSF